MYEVIVGASYGAVIGVGYSLVGYATEKTGEDGGSFELYGLGKAVLAGIIAGGSLGFAKVPITGYEQLMAVTIADMSAIALSQKVLHIGYNLLERFKKMFKK